MLTVVTWFWGKKYGPSDVAKLVSGVTRHMQQPHRMLIVQEGALVHEIECDNDYLRVVPLDERDHHLLAVPGCFARLRMFDPEWQRAHNLDERIICMDLDSVITGPLDLLFNRAETFMILQGANASNPCPFNGSLMMLRAGAHPDVWSDFSLEKAKAVPFYEFPDDQGWLHHKLPKASGWKVGSQSGVYAFQKPGWPKGDDLPKDACMVVFPGWRSPEKFKHLKWIQENWV